MWLFKYRNTRRVSDQLVGFSAHYQDLKWPVVSPVTICLSIVLAGLCWYPSFTQLEAKKAKLQLNQVQLMKRDQALQRLILQTEKPTWLADFTWLTWQAETHNAKHPSLTNLKEGARSSKSPLLTYYISLKGVASYQDWSKILNRLFDEYSLRPKSEHIYWLASGLLDVRLELQLVTKKLALKKYSLLARRGYRNWPKEIEVQAALSWHDKRSLKLRVGESSLTLTQGDWVPELAANLVTLDADKAVFRQQVSATRQADLERSDLVIPYLNLANFEGVTLSNLDKTASKIEQLDSVSMIYGEQEDEI